MILSNWYLVLTLDVARTEAVNTFLLVSTNDYISRGGVSRAKVDGNAERTGE